MSGRSWVHKVYRELRVSPALWVQLDQRVLKVSSLNLDRLDLLGRLGRLGSLGQLDSLDSLDRWVRTVQQVTRVPRVARDLRDPQDGLDLRQRDGLGRRDLVGYPPHTVPQVGRVPRMHRLAPPEIPVALVQRVRLDIRGGWARWVRLEKREQRVRRDKLRGLEPLGLVDLPARWDQMVSVVRLEPMVHRVRRVHLVESWVQLEHLVHAATWLEQRVNPDPPGQREFPE